MTSLTFPFTHLWGPREIAIQVVERGEKQKGQRNGNYAIDRSIGLEYELDRIWNELPLARRVPLYSVWASQEDVRSGHCACIVWDRTSVYVRFRDDFDPNQTDSKGRPFASNDEPRSDDCLQPNLAEQISKWCTEHPVNRPDYEYPLSRSTDLLDIVWWRMVVVRLGQIEQVLPKYRELRVYYDARLYFARTFRDLANEDERGALSVCWLEPFCGPNFQPQLPYVGSSTGCGWIAHHCHGYRMIRRC